MLKTENTLAEKYPELAKQWHPDNPKSPSEYSYGSNEIVLWLEPYYSLKHAKWFYFVYPAAINKRVHGAKNPFVSGHKVWEGFNDLKSQYPQIAAEWDYERNGDLRPEHFTYGSSEEVWWCITTPHPVTGKPVKLHWQHPIKKRVSRGDQCPFLSGRAICVGFNDLATTHPKLAQEWDYDANKLTPEEVTRKSNTVAHWKKYHLDVRTGRLYCFRWESEIASRKDDASDCPYLCGKKIMQGFNDLATTHPHLAEEWHPTLNGDLKPTDVTYGSKTPVWWRVNILGKWHDYTASPHARRNGALGHPDFASKSKLEITIAAILRKHNLAFKEEAKFADCLSEINRKMPFDFYVENNLLIEGDGIQHFEIIDFFGGQKTWETQVQHDNMKNMYSCRTNKPLLRIPHIYTNNYEKMEEFILYFVRTHEIPQEILDFYSQYTFSNYTQLHTNQIALAA